MNVTDIRVIGDDIRITALPLGGNKPLEETSA